MNAELKLANRTTNILDNQNVYLIKVNKKSDEPFLYIYDAGKSLREYNHCVKVILNNVEPNELLWDMEKFPIIEVGNWIPKTICGMFRQFFWAVRSIYTALYSVAYMHGKKSTTVILVDAHCVAMPVLKRLTKYKVVTFEYFRELLNSRKVTSVDSNRFRTWCMKFSDEIIVPSLLAKRQFLHLTESDHPLTVTPLYPPVEAEHLRGVSYIDLLNQYEAELKNRDFYLAVGPWHPKSEFAMTIQAFVEFYELLEYKLKSTVALIVLGYLDWDDFEANEYRRNMHEMLKTVRCRESISMITNANCEVRANFYRISTAVLNTTRDDVFNWSVLEAQYFGTPIISTDSGFASECIKYGINGILCRGEPEHYANSMFRMKLRPETFASMGQDASDMYGLKYSSILYGQHLLKIIKKYDDRHEIKPDRNIEEVIIPSDTLFESQPNDEKLENKKSKKKRRRRKVAQATD